MKNWLNTKKLLALSGLLILAGIIVGAFGVFLGGRMSFYIDGSGVHPYSDYYGRSNSELSEPVTLSKTSLDKFLNISIDIRDLDIHIIPSDGYYLEYSHLTPVEELSYSVKNDTFTLSSKTQQPAFQMNLIGFSSLGTIGADSLGETNYVNLYVPSDSKFKTVSLQNDYGDITLEDIISEQFTCTTNDGELKLKNITADTIKLSNDYGDTSTETLSGKNISIEASDGEIDLASLQCDDLTLTNDYGEVRIHSLNALRSNITLSDGDITCKLEKIESLKIKNSYGDIDLKLPEPLENYDADLETSYGDMELPDIDSISSDDDRAYYRNKKDNAPKLQLQCSDGDITLTH